VVSRQAWRHTRTRTRTHLFTATKVKYCSDGDAAPPAGDVYARFAPATEPTFTHEALPPLPTAVPKTEKLTCSTV